jgi:hypothetical protein
MFQLKGLKNYPQNRRNQMNKCLDNCTGTAVIEWEREFFEDLHESREKLLDYIIQNGQTLREHYCSEVCPVQKFRRKYERK